MKKGVGSVGGYPKEQREALTAVAVGLHAQRVPYREIAEEIGVNINTAHKWVRDEMARQSEHRSVSDARETAIATYEVGIKDCWERLKKLPADSHAQNVAGLHNNIRTYQERVDKLTGAEAAIKHQQVEDEYEVVWEDFDPAEAYDAPPPPQD